MSITAVATLGTGAEGGSSDTSFTLTTSAQLDAGNEGILVVVTDNNDATGETTHHSSVTDTDANTYSKLAEYTYSPGSVALDGVTVSIWRVRPASNLASAATVTITLANNATDKCASFYEFSSANAMEIVGTTQFTASNVTHPPSVSISGLSSKEYLFFRGVGKEINTTTALTPTTSYTAIEGTRSRNNSAAVTVRGEFIIATATGHTSAPTMNTISDTATAFIALQESAGGGGGATLVDIIGMGVIPFPR